MAESLEGYNKLPGSRKTYVRLPLKSKKQGRSKRPKSTGLGLYDKKGYKNLDSRTISFANYLFIVHNANKTVLQ